ncbi:MAG: RNA-binding protein [Chloroflexi bacterium RBG_16_57_9]|nr:MAG: RNA-binding protein [Chloroflexi bacterium RBG_16_57_9]
MTTKLYVGNLSYDTTEEDLRELFAKAGNVESVALPTDRETGRPRGFGFVEMSTAAEAQKAISQLNGQTVRDREIKVNESRPQEQRGSGSGSRGGYSGSRDRAGGNRGRSRY